MFMKFHIPRESKDEFIDRVMKEALEAKREGEEGPFLVWTPAGNMQDITDIVERMEIH